MRVKEYMEKTATNAAYYRLTGNIAFASVLDKVIEAIYKEGKQQGIDEDELYEIEVAARNSVKVTKPMTT